MRPTDASRFHDIAQTLRLRICLLDPGQTHVLHENSLAREFGVSRTPIRQALQRLAYERLIETRSGVGNVVPPLPEGRLGQDCAVLAGLLEVAAGIAEGPLPLALRIEVAAMQVSLATWATTGPDAAERFALHARVADVIRALVNDQVLAEAISAIHWRVLRVICHAPDVALDGHNQALRSLMAALMEAGTAAAALGRMAAFFGDLDPAAGKPPRT